MEQELDWLEKLGIFEKMGFSEWAIPIVYACIVKHDGYARICGYYKVTVNKAAKIDAYPLPRIEDLFVLLNGGMRFMTLDLAHAC